MNNDVQQVERTATAGAGGGRDVVVATSAGVRRGDGATVLDGRSVDAVAVDGERMWALTDARRLWLVDGDDETEVAELPRGSSATCVVVHREGVWVAGDEVGLWRLDGSALVPVASFGDAPTRPDWHTPWGGPPAIFSMASSSSAERPGAPDGDDLYVGVHVGGILRTSDDGATWTATIDLHDDVHQVAVDDHGDVWAATGMRGLAHSTDRGATWHYHDEGLHATYLLAVAVTDDGVLVGASSGHAGRDGALYRFDGERFHRCDGGLPDRFDGAVSPRHLSARGRRAAVALPDDRIYLSDDGGRSWTAALGDVSRVSEVVVVPA